MILQNNILLPFVVGDLWLILCYTLAYCLCVHAHEIWHYGRYNSYSGLFSLLLHLIFIFAETRRNSCPPWWSLVIFLNLSPNQQELYPWFFKTAVLQYFSKFPPSLVHNMLSNALNFYLIAILTISYTCSLALLFSVCFQNQHMRHFRTS